MNHTLESVQDHQYLYLSTVYLHSNNNEKKSK